MHIYAYIHSAQLEAQTSRARTHTHTHTHTHQHGETHTLNNKEATPTADEGAGERRFARTHVPPQQNHVTRVCRSSNASARVRARERAREIE